MGIWISSTRNASSPGNPRQHPRYPCNWARPRARPVPSAAASAPGADDTLITQAGRCGAATETCAAACAASPSRSLPQALASDVLWREHSVVIAGDYRYPVWRKSPMLSSHAATAQIRLFERPGLTRSPVIAM